MAMTDTCPVVPELLGIDLGPCGKPVTRYFRRACEMRHGGIKPMCAHHAELLTTLAVASVYPVYCGDCAAAGHRDVPLTIIEVTAEEAAQ